MKSTRTSFFFIILLALVLLFSLVLFPARSRRLERLNNADLPNLDTWLGYTAQQAQALAAQYSPAARSYYATTELTLDLAFPLVYSAWLLITLSSIRRMLALHSGWSVWAWQLPYAVLAADLLENTAIAILFWGYPTQLASVAWAASLFSALKWLLGALCLGLVIGGALWLAAKTVQRRLT
jgi:hypothetical protein